jgi:hypothetical protein
MPTRAPLVGPRAPCVDPETLLPPYSMASGANNGYCSATPSLTNVLWQPFGNMQTIIDTVGRFNNVRC